MELVIKRHYNEAGTNGELYLNGKLLCYTIELPWKNNQPQVSCIPEGVYALKKRYTARFGSHFILANVPNRSYILLHAANDALKELKGCIAPASQLTGTGKGSLSRKALSKVVAAVYPALERREPVFIRLFS